MRRVVITGLDPISCIGDGREDALASLQKSGRGSD
jgi:hypothetical protein